jgi:hypothetical protein
MKTTAKALNEKFLKLIEGYNQNQSKYPDIIKQYAPAVQEEKRQLHLQEGVKLYRPQFESLLTDTGSAISLTITEKNKLKYPLRFSDNSSDRLLGEQKLTNARLLFTQFQKNPDVLASELQTIIEANDRDSAFGLIDIAFLSTGDARTEDQQKFNFIKDTYCQNSGLNDIDNELSAFQLLEENINKAVSALTDNVPYLLFGFITANIPDEEFFNLQSNLKSHFGESTFQKVKQL